MGLVKGMGDTYPNHNVFPTIQTLLSTIRKLPKIRCTLFGGPYNKAPTV